MSDEAIERGKLAAELKRDQPRNTKLHRYIELAEAAARPPTKTRTTCPRCSKNREKMREHMRQRRLKEKQERK